MHLKDNKHCICIWLFQTNYEFAYEANRTQIHALADISNIARQDLTVNCHNTVAYYDSPNGDYKNAVQLRGFDERVMTAGGRRRKKGTLKYSVDETEDECQVGGIRLSIS